MTEPELSKCLLCREPPKYAMREYVHLGLKRSSHLVYCEGKLWKHKNEAEDYSKERVVNKWNVRQEDMHYAGMYHAIRQCRDAMVEGNETGRFDRLIAGCSEILGD
jgi:hypothetical protein